MDRNRCIYLCVSVRLCVRRAELNDPYFEKALDFTFQNKQRERDIYIEKKRERKKNECVA